MTCNVSVTLKVLDEDDPAKCFREWLGVSIWRNNFIEKRIENKKKPISKKIYGILLINRRFVEVSDFVIENLDKA